MADKKKECKRCHDKKPLAEFPKSAFAKDGHLGYCSVCWPKMTSKSMKRKKHKPASRKKDDKLIDLANDALKRANGTEEQFLVRTNDRKPKVLVFKKEDAALRQAMEWKMKGHAVTVWRQCAFEMVLRIIG